MQKVDYQYDDSHSMWKIEMVIFVCVCLFLHTQNFEYFQAL